MSPALLVITTAVCIEEDDITATIRSLQNVRHCVRLKDTFSLGYNGVTYTATQARSNLYRLIDQVSKSHKPIHITGKNTGAVLISEEDWSALH